MTAAFDLKEQGNAAWKEGNIPLAMTSWIQAQQACTAEDGSNMQAILQSNLSNAFLAIDDPETALSTAQLAIEADPMFPKGHYRKAMALRALRRWAEAKEVLDFACVACSRQGEDGGVETPQILVTGLDQANLDMIYGPQLTTYGDVVVKRSRGRGKGLYAEREYEAGDDIVTDIAQLAISQIPESTTNKGAATCRNCHASLFTAAQQAEGLVKPEQRDAAEAMLKDFELSRGMEVQKNEGALFNLALSDLSATRVKSTVRPDRWHCCSAECDAQYSFGAGAGTVVAKTAQAAAAADGKGEAAAGQKGKLQEKEGSPSEACRTLLLAVQAACTDTIHKFWENDDNADDNYPFSQTLLSASCRVLVECLRGCLDENEARASKSSGLGSSGSSSGGKTGAGAGAAGAGAGAAPGGEDTTIRAAFEGMFGFYCSAESPEKVRLPGWFDMLKANVTAPLVQVEWCNDAKQSKLASSTSITGFFEPLFFKRLLTMLQLNWATVDLASPLSVHAQVVNYSLSAAMEVEKQFKEGKLTSSEMAERLHKLDPGSYPSAECGRDDAVTLVKDRFRTHGTCLQTWHGNRTTPSVVIMGVVHSTTNHSCEPNAGWSHAVSVPGKGLQVLLVAKRAIRKGEEILISYISREKVEGAGALGVEERQKELGEHWGFVCQCPLCVEQSK